jgi:SHS2 domain-containing protein
VGYRLLEGLTRADVAFRAEEKDLEELFRTAWRATLELMLPDPSRLRARERRRIRLANPAVDLLLFDFLGELLYYKDAAGLLLDLESLAVREGPSGYSLEAEAAGEAPDPARHALGVDVKAVTLHQLAVERSPGGWQATVVVDV